MIRIVGAGLAGLYAAYKLRKLGLQVIVYEKNVRIGGRIGTLRFAGRDVPTGAGVVREKDRLMRTLCA
jgi:monoamine oxidase